ncbi:MAG TPA: YgeY family selenium metabolism-linked hydrolase [Actinomycetota bacterium]|nr:YgeY family selenium metabolism-linked hydrolase [Actinomycetota bacterium]
MASYLKDAERYRTGVTNFLRDLVALPSPSGGEKAVAERVVEEMTRLGYDEVRIDRMGNAIGRVGTGDTVIVFDAHMDTVGTGDPSSWGFDPFEGKIEDGVVYGRGAGDDKGSVAAMVYGGGLCRSRALDGVDATVYVVGTVMEEDCDGLALGHVLTESIPVADWVIIGESTSLDVYRGQRGRMEMSVTFRGRSAHASAPERGDNAISKMAPLVAEITALNDRLAGDEFLGKGTIAVTKIECETPSLNAIPDSCTIYLDRRLARGETRESAVKEVAGLPSAAGAEIDVPTYAVPSWKGVTPATDKYYPTWVLDEEHPLVQAGVAAVTEALGAPPGIGRWIFSTNGVASAGRLGIPTIGFGPGDERTAHTTDDRCPVDHLVKCIAAYAAMPKHITGIGR